MKWDFIMTTNINIVIPMAGRSLRFKNNYHLPKPLIDINGKPTIQLAVDSLDVDGNFIFIVQKEHCDKFNLDSILYAIKPNCKIIKIDYITEGPASTVLLARDYIDNDEELIVANCDQIMEWDGSVFLNCCRMYDGAVVTYYENSIKNSYAKIDSKGKVTEIKEKQVISNISLNGIHYWKKGKYFVNSVEEMILANERYNNEFYIGPSYNQLIKKGYAIGIHHIPNEQHNAVGIPEDLEKYIQRIC